MKKRKEWNKEKFRYRKKKKLCYFGHDDDEDDDWPACTSVKKN